jgi:hypothetical protein
MFAHPAISVTNHRFWFFARINLYFWNKYNALGMFAHPAISVTTHSSGTLYFVIST